MTILVLEFRSDTTFALPCQHHDLLMLTRHPSFLHDEPHVLDLWHLRDGDRVTFTNRISDLPPWFELHPTEVSGALAFEYLRKLENGWKPGQVMQGLISGACMPAIALPGWAHHVRDSKPTAVSWRCSTSTITPSGSKSRRTANSSTESGSGACPRTRTLAPGSKAHAGPCRWSADSACPESCRPSGSYHRHPAVDVRLLMGPAIGARLQVRRAARATGWGP